MYRCICSETRVQYDGDRGVGRRRAVRRSRPVAVAGAGLLDTRRRRPGTTVGGVRGRRTPGRKCGIVFVVFRGRRVGIVRGHHVQRLRPVVSGRPAGRRRRNRSGHQLRLRRPVPSPSAPVLRQRWLLRRGGRLSPIVGRLRRKAVGVRQ